MKKWMLCAALLGAASYSFASQELQIEVKSDQTQLLKVAIMMLSPFSPELQEVATTLQKDIQMSKQCVAFIESIEQLSDMAQIKSLADKNVYMAIILQESEKKDGIDWRLYDTAQVSMLHGARFYKEQDVQPWMWGHAISNKIWPYMIGQPGCFLSKIAYCKEVKHKKHTYRHIYVSDIHGDHEQPLVQRPFIIIAPRWNSRLQTPLIFYSECALANVRLCMANMHGVSKIICNCDGINMLPAFSPDDKEIVFCLTKDGTSQLYHYAFDKKYNKKVCKKITFNNGNNLSPCFIDAHTLVFASDYEGSHPHLYTMSLLTKEMKPLITKGYCACPAYCKGNNTLAYGKMVKGVMQIFSYDFVTQHHEQLTFGNSNKEEPSWSPCGNFITYAEEKSRSNRICIVHVGSKKSWHITSSHESCTYPAWSPEYKVL